MLGSTRTTSPPWGGPKRLGERVAKFLVNQLKLRTNVKHVIDFVDLLEVKLPLLDQPHHYYAPGTAPPELEALAQRVKAADCYVFVSPEYNHSASPALRELLYILLFYHPVSTNTSQLNISELFGSFWRLLLRIQAKSYRCIQHRTIRRHESSHAIAFIDW